MSQVGWYWYEIGCGRRSEKELRPVFWKHHCGGNLGAAWGNDEYVYHLAQTHGGTVIWERSKVGKGRIEEVYRSNLVQIS
jgi:hypothetical protein